ncbi:MAG: hypothetical protein RBS51_01995 [Anaerovoracaceae bacterium]|jgi:hypothetical protein|nr:hypothetical protein [Anaerovoracaceae bacterium]
MKQFIVLVAMIALGVFIYGIIAGPGENTIESCLERSWEDSIRIRSNFVQEMP